ncbi:hypothetical protein GGI07_003704 [Coemansia sp. Benny D115]|nr:hypothetical protein GGI07_003704 [Coemansia sp. Benny D115]
MLPLAGVCRKWRRMMHEHLHSTIIVEYRPKAPINGPQQRPGAKNRVSPASVWTPRAAIKKFNSKAENGVSKQQYGQLRNAEWATNIKLFELQGAQDPIKATKLRIQAFVDLPDYEGLVAAMVADGFSTQSWTSVTSIEIVDFAGTPGLAGGNGSPTGSPSIQDPSFASVARFMLQHMPNIVELSSSTWDISASNRCLASHLLSVYSTQLHHLDVHVLPSAIKASRPVLGNQLTVLQVQTRVLQLLGAATVPAAQLKTLKLCHVDPYFSWEAFAGASGEELEFTSLTTLGIDFEKDNVANDTHRQEAQRGGKCPWVTMGVDSRRVRFPKLHTLAVRRVPYTYTDAWSMFLDSPLKSLYVAGKLAHVRYIDMSLFSGLDILDVHLYLTEQAQGKFSTFVKTMFTVESAVRSAWVRHSEIFPISVPDVVGWQNVRELNITAYIPPFTLMSLVSQMPQLCLLVVQRVARDVCETILESGTGVDLSHLQPTSIVSTSIRELQLHMAGNGVRVPTLQTICYLLLSMPKVHKLAIKQGYWERISEFAKSREEKNPHLAQIELVHHISMQARSALAGYSTG